MSSSAYTTARESYAALGVDTEAALTRLAATPISLHCWQGDDVGGFENPNATLSGGGIQATGNYSGKARNLHELRQDLELVYKLLPGRHRLNLHAIYGDFGPQPVDRDAIEPRHFASWIDWAKARGLHGLDFNPSCFSHPLAAAGTTLSHPDAGIRDFWIRHCAAARRIGAGFGEAFGSPAVNNIWIPDASKDVPYDRLEPRRRLAASLDRVFAEKLPAKHLIDAVESKLFGIGAESYTVGSHEFYLGYAIKRGDLAYCLDAGHFHPTESIADKISAILQNTPSLLLHVSRGVRWDSDHVVICDDATRAIFEEVVRGNFLDRTMIGLDYFDASINRIAAWVIGTRAAQKALLAALLEPSARLRNAEEFGNHALRLALFEECRALPLGLVWDEFCRRHDTPSGIGFMDEIAVYEQKILSAR
ncbi:MAG: L-rhamnose isomerase [Verrucomicrobia bacterium]|nr:L-rhamnose isomerase [Verrucomicrobiota bacterium]